MSSMSCGSSRNVPASICSRRCWIRASTAPKSWCYDRLKTCKNHCKSASKRSAKSRTDPNWKHSMYPYIPINSHPDCHNRSISSIASPLQAVVQMCRVRMTIIISLMYIHVYRSTIVMEQVMLLLHENCLWKHIAHYSTMCVLTHDTVTKSVGVYDIGA
jgi:hypothetical protein